MMTMEASMIDVLFDVIVLALMAGALVIGVGAVLALIAVFVEPPDGWL